jgi:hypothetical protein
MSNYFTDTRPEAEAILIQLTRQAPPWRKLQMMEQLNQSARTLMMAGLRERYPQAGDPELRRRLADLVLGPTLAKEVYGPLEKALR